MATAVGSNNVTTKETAKVGLCSPWMELFRKIEAMFHEDEAVKVTIDDDKHIINLDVSGTTKAKAIKALLPAEVTMGIITVKIVVNEVDDFDATDITKVYRQAFSGNPALIKTETVDVGGKAMNFVVFAKEVVQYFNDDISDLHGLHSTLYQDIARDVFTGQAMNDSVFFNTTNGRD